MSTTFRSADLVAMDPHGPRQLLSGLQREGGLPLDAPHRRDGASSSAANPTPFGIDPELPRVGRGRTHHVSSVGVGSVAVTNVKRELTLRVARDDRRR